ncbi:hypothetical protein BO99DRAFT_445398 [Aspergillus violaceofuscus CBS 115571]|uniref:Zn(2)-C6 fungal-type domain-containing protein n=1 Tax=Aspergillus violaceofuscus (strain CBS 115571) TaxID=1450538 RepID=A0A2V5HX38_ASPV1|nr:hypothetical protein BO99DRAFT_445398 [Aspergillus violaceofuscus CBS 115571]
MTEDSPSSVPRRHRRGLTRSAAACQRCRRRKQKCDGRLPTCGPCAAAGTSCVMSDRLVVRPGDAQCECDDLRARLATAEQRCSDLLQENQRLQVQIMEAFQSPGPAAHEPRTPMLSVAKDAGHSTAAGSGPQPQHIPLDGTTDLAFQYCERILRPTFANRPGMQKVNRSTLSGAWELWGDDTSVEVPLNSAVEISHETYASLAETFFDRRWPYLPVLHRPTFWEQHLNPFLAHPEARSISRFFVKIVCAIAATERSCQLSNDDMHRKFFKDAVKDLELIAKAGDLEYIQCLLLLSMYGHNEPQSVNMWYTTGMALHLAIGIDLHRKESLMGQDVLQAEMMKRIFWCAYVMQCSMAINMGRPLMIEDSDITIALPLQRTDQQLRDQMAGIDELTIPSVTDMSTFNHIIALRQINAGVYKQFHPRGGVGANRLDLDQLRNRYNFELNQWLITAPRYVHSLSTFQSTEWFQIAFHHAMLSLYRPSRAIPIPLPDDLRICLESAIGLISSYSSLYARNRIKYTFVAIHSLLMAAVTMLYSLRASASLRQELTKPVVQTNIQTFLTLFRGICNGREVGEKCSQIVERLGNSILTLYDDTGRTDAEVDTEFQSWFGLQTHTPAQTDEAQSHTMTPHFPDVRVDLPWADLFTEGINMASTDVWSIFS